MRHARFAPLLFSLALACEPAAPAESPVVEPLAPVVVVRPPRAAEFPLPSDFSAQLLWSDGADLLVFTGWPHNTAKRLERSGATLDGRAPENAVDIAGRGVGADADVIIAGSMGETARLRNGVWDFGLAPALDGEGLAAVAFDPSGRAFVAGRHRALYMEQNDTWTTYPYPSSGLDAVDLVVARDGTPYVVGAHGRILAFSAGAFRDVPLSGVPGDALEEAWQVAWLDPATNRLWVGVRAFLVSIDLHTGVASTRKLPMYTVDAMTGVSTPSGAVLAIAGASAIVLFDGEAFHKIDGAPDGAKSLAIDANHAVLHVASYNGVFHVPLKHPAFGAGHEKRAEP